MGSADNTHAYDADWTAGIQYAATLTPQEMAIRDLVVKEYVFDENWTHACMRCGFNGMLAQEFGQRFSKDPYVIWKLRQLHEEKVKMGDKAVEEDAAQMRRLVIESLKREALNTGAGSTQAARVGALSKLAQIYDMDAPKKVDINATHRGGVMVVPTIANVDDWESIAAEAQQKLSEETLNGLT